MRPQRLKPSILAPCRRPKGLLHPVGAKRHGRVERSKGLLHPVGASNISDMQSGELMVNSPRVSFGGHYVQVT